MEKGLAVENIKRKFTDPKVKLSRDNKDAYLFRKLENLNSDSCI